MNYLTCPLLNDEEIKIIQSKLDGNTDHWEDGKKTVFLIFALFKLSIYRYFITNYWIRNPKEI